MKLPEPPPTPKFSLPANAPGSYGLAGGLIVMAVSSAAAIEEPLHRTIAIGILAVLAYFVGLRTRTQ